MKPRLLATSACLALLATGLPARAAPPPGARPAAAQQQVGHYLELVVDERGQGLSGGVFDFPVHPDRVAQVYFPEDIERGTGFPGSKFHVEMGKRRVTIYPTRRAVRKRLQANVTLKTSSVAVGLVLRVVDTPQEAVTMAFVTKRSEVEARQAEGARLAAEHERFRARLHQESATLERNAERERRGEELVASQLLERLTILRPTEIVQYQDPARRERGRVTIERIEGIWSGDRYYMTYVLHNGMSKPFPLHSVHVFDEAQQVDHAGIAYVRAPAEPAEGLIGVIPPGHRVKGIVRVVGMEHIDTSTTLMLTSTGGLRPVIAAIPEWELVPRNEEARRRAGLVDPTTISLHLQAVYGAIWLGDGAGLDQSDATSLTGLGARVTYGINRLLAFEAELMGGGTGAAHFGDATWNGMQGDLARSAVLGRVQLGGVLRFGRGPYVPLARLGVGLQGASHSGRLTTATGEAPGPGSFEWTTFGAFGAGLDVRFGDFLAGLALSVLTPWGEYELSRRSIEANIHLGYRWNP